MPIDKFYRFIFHKAASIFGEDFFKNLQLTFQGHPVYYELYSCCKYSLVFFECVLTSFSALLLLSSLLFAFILYFISFYVHYIFSVQFCRNINFALSVRPTYT